MGLMLPRKGDIPQAVHDKAVHKESSEERVRQIKAKLGPMKSGMPKQTYEKLSEEIRMYARMQEGIHRAMPRMPRTYKQAATLLTLNWYHGRG